MTLWHFLAENRVKCLSIQWGMSLIMKQPITSWLSPCWGRVSRNIPVIYAANQKAVERMEIIQYNLICTSNSEEIEAAWQQRDVREESNNQKKWCASQIKERLINIQRAKILFGILCVSRFLKWVFFIAISVSRTPEAQDLDLPSRSLMSPVPPPIIAPCTGARSCSHSSSQCQVRGNPMKHCGYN